MLAEVLEYDETLAEDELLAADRIDGLGYEDGVSAGSFTVEEDDDP